MPAGRCSYYMLFCRNVYYKLGLYDMVLLFQLYIRPESKIGTTCISVYMNVKYYEKEMEEGYTAADNLYSYTRWAILFLTLFPSKKIDYFLSGGGVLSIPSPV